MSAINIIVLFLPLLFLVLHPKLIHAAPQSESHLCGYRCPQQNGYFKYTDPCDEYVQCQNYIPITHTCPVGLHFNFRMQMAKVPCDQPSRAQCKPAYKTQTYRSPINHTPPPTTTTTTTKPPPIIVSPPVATSPKQRDFTCPQAHGYYEHSNDCREYVECKNYIPLKYTCPGGLHFNPSVQWTDYPCDYPTKVQCQKQPTSTTTTRRPTTTSTTTTTTTPRPTGRVLPGYTCPQPHGYFEYTDRCDEYVECKNYEPRTYACPSNLHFNPNVQWTEYPCHHPTRAQCYKK